MVVLKNNQSRLCEISATSLTAKLWVLPMWHPQIIYIQDFLFYPTSMVSLWMSIQWFNRGYWYPLLLNIGCPNTIASKKGNTKNLVFYSLNILYQTRIQGSSYILDLEPKLLFFFNKELYPIIIPPIILTFCKLKTQTQWDYKYSILTRSVTGFLFIYLFIYFFFFGGGNHDSRFFPGVIFPW